MKTKFLIILTLIIGFSALSLLFIFEEPSELKVSDDRRDLKEVVYASTICSTFWRTNLFDMWENKTHDYKNDPIYQECREMLEAKNRCLDSEHIWNRNGTCTLTSVYPGGSGMGFKYGKYVSGTFLENEN